MTLRLEILWEFGRTIAVSQIFDTSISLISACVTAWIYSGWLGWWLALTFIVLFIAHEVGHVGAAKLAGKNIRSPKFIPFLGAFIESPKDWSKFEEAFIAAAGPLSGCVAVLLLLLGVTYIHVSPDVYEVAIAASFLASCMNLANMLPVSPLDGGRIAQAISWWFRVLGIAILGSLTYYFTDPFLLVLWVIAMGEFRMLAGLRLCVSVAGVILFIVWYVFGVHESGPYHQLTVLVDLLFLLVLTYGFFKIWYDRARARENRLRRDGLSPSRRLVLFLLWMVLSGIAFALFWWTGMHLPESYRPAIFF